MHARNLITLSAWGILILSLASCTPPIVETTPTSTLTLTPTSSPSPTIMPSPTTPAGAKAGQWQGENIAFIITADGRLVNLEFSLGIFPQTCAFSIPEVSTNPDGSFSYQQEGLEDLFSQSESGEKPSFILVQGELVDATRMKGTFGTTFFCGNSLTAISGERPQWSAAWIGPAEAAIVPQATAIPAEPTSPPQVLGIDVPIDVEGGALKITYAGLHEDTSDTSKLPLFLPPNLKPENPGDVLLVVIAEPTGDGTLEWVQKLGATIQDNLGNERQAGVTGSGEVNGELKAFWVFSLPEKASEVWLQFSGGPAIDLGTLMFGKAAAGAPPAPQPTFPPATARPEPAETQAPAPTLPPAAAGAGGTGLIAFSSTRDGNPEIYTIQADGSGEKRLTNDPAPDYEPAWSPDGEWLAFVSERDGNGEIYLMDRDGKDLKNLTQNDSFDGGPAWSPDGSSIAFFSYRDGNYELYVMERDGSHPKRITTSGRTDSYPSWSPDGKRMAFHVQQNDNWDIYLINADGSGEKRLTTRPEADWLPVWAAFEDHPNPVIVYWSEVDDGWELRVADPEVDFDQAASGPIEMGGGVSRPAFSKDFSSLAISMLSAGQQDVFTIDIAGFSGLMELKSRPDEWQALTTAFGDDFDACWWGPG